MTSPLTKIGIAASLTLATMCSMSLWFSATAVSRPLAEELELSGFELAWLTMAVQLGFVVGAVGSAAFNLADRVSPRILFAIGSFVGAIINASIAWVDLSIGYLIFARLVTGVVCAAIYPVGMKIMASWTKRNRGLALGVLVGAVVLGSSSPHLLRAISPGDNWRIVFYLSSALTLLGGILALAFAKTGPYHVGGAKFRFAYMFHAFSDRQLRLANLGYLGHMWELYAMWTWIATFLAASNEAFGWSVAKSQIASSVIAFCAIAAGAPGSIVAGRLADRWGRSLIAMACLFVSGACSLGVGFLFGGNPYLLTAVCLVWGFAVVADSAQFSACVSELSDPAYVGTQLTTQTACGFLLTLTTIQIMPAWVDLVGWRFGFLYLIVGPMVGAWAMWKLGRLQSLARTTSATDRG